MLSVIPVEIVVYAKKHVLENATVRRGLLYAWTLIYAQNVIHIYMLL